MEDNLSQAFEKRPDGDRSINLYCMICALNIARLAPGTPETEIHTIMLSHVSGRIHKGKVNKINNPRKKTK